MDSTLAISILFGLFIVFLTLGVPLAGALFFSSFVVILIDPNLDFTIIPLRIFSGINSFLLLSIYGFMFSAFLMNRIGVTDDIVAISDLLVGRIRGGLAHVNITASMLMGGASGSSTADVAGIGSIMIPAMNKRAYSPGFSASITAASSAIGSIIPPSILMIIYGATANISIGAIFVAGYIPGLLVGIQQLVYSYAYARKNQIQVDRRTYSMRDRLRILFRGLIPMSVVVVIIGGIVSGIMTATESAAVASVYTILLGIVIYRRITRKMLLEVATETALLSSLVMLCVGTATLFGWLMSFYQVLEVVQFLITGFIATPQQFLIFSMILFLILGSFMDPTPAMLIFVPVLAPMAYQVGADPLVLGIIVVMALAVGKITPPYGISLLLACSIAKIPLAQAMKHTLALFIVFCALMILFIFVPELITFLPKILIRH